MQRKLSNVKETVCEDVNLIHLVQDKVQRQAVNMVIHL